jgi:hypothetical protein
MATRQQYFTLLGQMAAIRTQMAASLAAQRPGDTDARDLLSNQLDTLEQQLQQMIADNPPAPADGGFAAAIGIGDQTATQVGGMPAPIMVPGYDEAVTSERLYAVGDLYYCYQIERLGMFRAVQTLQQLFEAGTIRLVDGDGALSLFRFDRRQVLRHTERQRGQCFKRVLGYTDAPAPRGSRPNTAFHHLFTQFNLSVAQLFRDKRIAETFRPGAGPSDPGFGSMAVVRRWGLDTRNNLKRASYGDVNVLTVELLQLIAEAFEILSAEDVRHQFGTDNGWDTLEEVLHRYLGETPVVSPRSRMAVAGRSIVNFLAEGHILTSGRAAFEALIQGIAEASEEWLTSAQALGAMRGAASERPAGANVVEFPSRRRLSA